MSDPDSDRPSAETEGVPDPDDDFQDDALSELMTGAFAATSMVSMSVPEELPELPEWSPTDEPAPSAESLDQVSGTPKQIHSAKILLHPEPAPVVNTDEGPESEPSIDSIEIDEPDSEPSPQLQEYALDPPSEESEPVASISHESGAVVVQRRTPSEFTGAYEAVRADIDPDADTDHETAFVAGPDDTGAPSGGGRGVWIVVSMVAIAALVGGFFWMEDSGPQGATADASTVAATPDDAPDVSPAPVPREGMAAAPPKPAPAPADADALRATYTAAAKRYEANEDNDALLEMTVTACALRDGPTARSAFRKLIGAKARSKAVIACREDGIDVSADVEGFTAAEVAAQAQTALDDGRLDEALELAKKSNRTERNQTALVLIVQINCRQGATDKAQKMLRHVAEKRRQALADYCHEVGVDLQP